MVFTPILEKMKRNKLSSKSVMYDRLKIEEPPPPDECPAEDQVYQRPKKGGILCASSRKRFYFLLIITAVVLLWIGIYYKLLNHRFELPEPFRELRRMFGDGPSKNRRKFREYDVENINETIKHDSSVINIAIIACKDRLDEAMNALKSATMFTKYNLHLHIFTDEENLKTEYFDNKLKTWPGFQELWMMFYTYQAQYPDPVQVKDKKEWEDLFKPCASLRLFLAKLLPSVDSVIYVDIDVLFLRPPEDLWKYFEKFSSSQIAGLVMECGDGQKHCWYPHNAKHPYVGSYGVNTGVMLMNLTRMRKMKWEDDLVSIYMNNKLNLVFGDQDILNIYFHDHLNYLYEIPCEWNYRPDFCFDGNFCNGAIKKGIGILQGNRLAFRKAKVQPEFHVMFQAFNDYSFEDSIEDMIVNKTKLTLERKFFSTSCGEVLYSILRFNT